MKTAYYAPMSNPFLNTAETTKTTETKVPLQGLTVSDSAVARLRVLFAKESENTVFRIRVIGGGCSGFQYTFDMDTTTGDNDFTIAKDAFTVACDRDSLAYIDGGVIDFVDSLAGRYFTIHNPNATANCGCGTSFSV